MITQEHKLTMQFFLGCIITIAGLVLLFIGCFMPPAGKIDSSVLVAFGEASTFAGALIGVDYHYRYKFSKEDSNGKV